MTDDEWLADVARTTGTGEECTYCRGEATVAYTEAYGMPVCEWCATIADDNRWINENCAALSWKAQNALLSRMVGSYAEFRSLLSLPTRRTHFDDSPEMRVGIRAPVRRELELFLIRSGHGAELVSVTDKRLSRASEMLAAAKIALSDAQAHHRAALSARRASNRLKGKRSHKKYAL